MSKCIKCNKVIEKLIHQRSGYVSQDCNLIKLDKKDILDYGVYDFYEDDNVCEWLCPECDVCLFTDEEEAREFLK